jgi:hypothetical protein
MFKENKMSRSEILERLAKKVGYWAFNRYAVNRGYTIEQTLAVIRNTY